MDILRKIGAVIVMILCIAFFVVGVGGVFGAWWARGEGHRLVDDLGALTVKTAQRADEATTRIDAGLDRALSAVQSISTTVKTAGEKIEQHNEVIAAVDKILNTDLLAEAESLPGPVGALVDAAKTFRVTVDWLKQTNETLNKIPFLAQQPPPKLERLEKIDEALGKVEKTVQDVRNLKKDIADKAAATADVLAKVPATVARIDSDLSTAKTMVAEVKQSLGEIVALVPQIQARLASYMTTAAIGATFLFVWLAASQVSLFVHALGWFKGKGETADSQDGAG